MLKERKEKHASGDQTRISSEREIKLSPLTQRVALPDRKDKQVLRDKKNSRLSSCSFHNPLHVRASTGRRFLSTLQTYRDTLHAPEQKRETEDGASSPTPTIGTEQRDRHRSILLLLLLSSWNDSNTFEKQKKKNTSRRETTRRRRQSSLAGCLRVLD